MVQIPPYLYLLARNVQYWARPTPRSWLHGWVMEHQRNLMFCVQVTLYTGIANVADRFAPALTPFLFGLIDVGFIVWILTRERALRRLVVRSRLGLALVSALRGGRRREPARLSPRDTAWVRELFDLDRSGKVELDDVRALLAEQGVEATDGELRALRERLDGDGDGCVDADELAVFLAAWFATYPSNEDELALAFRSLDADGDGQITPEELRHALADGDEGLREPEIERIMRVTDLDASGTIDWEEFVEAMHRRPSRVVGGEELLARPTDRPPALEGAPPV